MSGQTIRILRGSWFSEIGTIVAMALSWAMNHSIFWLLTHGLFGWFYILYWGFKHGMLQALIEGMVK